MAGHLLRTKKCICVWGWDVKRNMAMWVKQNDTDVQPFDRNDVWRLPENNEHKRTKLFATQVLHMFLSYVQFAFKWENALVKQFRPVGTPREMVIGNVVRCVGKCFSFAAALYTNCIWFVGHELKKRRDASQFYNLRFAFWFPKSLLIYFCF